MGMVEAPTEEAIAKLVEQAWGQLDQNELVELVCMMIDTYSWRGYEKALAENMATWMKARDFDEVVVQEVEGNRANFIGRLKGSGGGPSLLFNGHMDTSYAADYDMDIASAGRAAAAKGYRAKALIEGDVIYGMGATNMKSSVGCQTYALHMIRKAGIKLPGDVYTTGVAGETESTPIKTLWRTYEGTNFRGSGIGTRFLVTHGYQPDMAIVTEPSAFRICRGRPGYIWFKVTTFGHHAYMPFRADGGSNSINAIHEMAKIVQYLEEYEPTYAQEHAYFLGDDEGYIVPRYGVAAIDAGWPYKAGFLPGICEAFVGMTTEPGRDAVAVQKELEALIARSGVKAEVECYLTKLPGNVTAADAIVVQEAKKAYEYVFGEKHTPPPTHGMNSFTDDSCIFRQMGIPTITWGPIDVARDPRYNECSAAYGDEGEMITICDLVLAAKMYAAATIRMCSQPYEEYLARRGSSVATLV